jgi:hypothetical protein
MNRPVAVAAVIIEAVNAVHATTIHEIKERRGKSVFLFLDPVLTSNGSSEVFL